MNFGAWHVVFLSHQAWNLTRGSWKTIFLWAVHSTLFNWGHSVFTVSWGSQSQKVVVGPALRGSVRFVAFVGTFFDGFQEKMKGHRLFGFVYLKEFFTVLGKLLWFFFFGFCVFWFRSFSLEGCKKQEMFATIPRGVELQMGAPLSSRFWRGRQSMTSAWDIRFDYAENDLRAYLNIKAVKLNMI